MARNEEKAQLMMNKWVTMKKQFNAGVSERRPYLATDCDNLTDAERWRRDIVREITKKVAEIQNAGLGEHRIRDINDAINKLIREKGHWQRRIRDLGGPDYNALEPKSFDADGRELPGGGGYKYFGAARELPGVRELFNQEAPQKARRTRGNMYKGITPDYYGFRDEDDGVLVAKESAAEKRFLAEADAEYRQERKRRRDAGEAVDDKESDEDDDEFLAVIEGATKATKAQFKAYVPVPSQEEISDAILTAKKARMLEMLGE